MEAEAGIPTPLLAVKMYSPFACLSTSRRSRERPDMGDIDPIYKYDLWLENWWHNVQNIDFSDKIFLQLRNDNDNFRVWMAMSRTS